jgi:serine/threonine protein kinase
MKRGTILSNYEIIRVLGDGGFSIVYLAVDRLDGTYVAIKEFFPEGLAVRRHSQIKPITRCLDDYLWAKSKFLEEAKVLSRFDNPSIVNIIKVFEIQETAYLVMEYVQGITMKAWLKQIEGAANQFELDLILEHILSALNLIHKNHMLHRDISPDNILLRNDLSPVLIDFGAAREDITRRTGTTAAVVKDGLSPPEQYSTDGTNQGPWSDIYSLSATLYYAISGNFPVVATDRAIEDTLIPLEYRHSGDYRYKFLKAIQWGLEILPAERPRTIADWKELLFG